MWHITSCKTHKAAGNQLQGIWREDLGGTLALVLPAYSCSKRSLSLTSSNRAWQKTNKQHDVLNTEVLAAYDSEQNCIHGIAKWNEQKTCLQVDTSSVYPSSISDFLSSMDDLTILSFSAFSVTETHLLVLLGLINHNNKETFSGLHIGGMRTGPLC